jgi:hypothetical protein
MTDDASTRDVRARIGDMLNRVPLRHDECVIERKGKTCTSVLRDVPRLPGSDHRI